VRRNPTKRIEEHRVTTGTMASDRSYGANGAFVVPHDGVSLKIVASDASSWKESGLPGKPWEHVSVSVQSRCPTWEEMDYVKRLFWRDDETVIQLHVPRDQHINCHQTCLHLWKPIGVEIPLPPSIAVAPTQLAGRIEG